MEPALTNIGIVLPEDGYLAGPRDHPPARRTAGDGRDAHAVRRTGWLHARLGAGARFRGGRQADRRRVPSAAYGMTAEIADRCPRPDARARDRRRRGRRHPHGERTGPRSHPRHAVVVPARGDFAVAIPLAERFTEGVTDVITRTAALARTAPRLPRGVLVLPAAPRRSRRRGHRRGARGLPAPVVAQPRRTAHAVPQHGAVQPAPHHRRRPKRRAPPADRRYRRHTREPDCRTGSPRSLACRGADTWSVARSMRALAAE